MADVHKDTQVEVPHPTTTSTSTTASGKEKEEAREDTPTAPTTPPPPPNAPVPIVHDPPGMKRVSIEDAYNMLHNRLVSLERAMEQLLTEWDRKGKTDALVGTLHEVLAHHHLGILHQTHAKTATSIATEGR